MMSIRPILIGLSTLSLVGMFFFADKVNAEENDEEGYETIVIEEEETTNEEEEEESVVEVIQVIEYVEPEEEEEVLPIYPGRHLSGTSSIVEENMLESLRSSHMDWLNALADGVYDYALLYDHEINEYQLAVFNDSAFPNGLGFWYVLETNNAPGIEGIRLLGSGGNRSDKNPATFYFDGDTGHMTRSVLPGNTFDHNLTHFGGSYMVATSIAHNETTGYSNAALVVPDTAMIGHEWGPIIEHSAMRIKGGGMYDAQKIATILFIAFSGWFVSHFAFVYFSRTG